MAIQLFSHLFEQTGKEDALVAYCGEGLFDVGLSEAQDELLTNMCSWHSLGRPQAVRRAKDRWTRNPNDTKSISHLMMTLETCSLEPHDAHLDIATIRREVAAHVADLAASPQTSNNTRHRMCDLDCLPDLISLCIRQAQPQRAAELCKLMGPAYASYQGVMHESKQAYPENYEAVAFYWHEIDKRRRPNASSSRTTFNPRYLGDIYPSFFGGPQRPLTRFEPTEDFALPHPRYGFY